MLVQHDIHLHTTLSACCSDPRSTAREILDRAAQKGIRTIGFSDHLWDERIPGASPWYLPQGLSRILEFRQNLPPTDLRVLVGCETEYCGGGKVGITSEVAQALDYVLIPFTHFHFGAFLGVPAHPSIEELGRLMLQRFKEVVELGLATGIAHPFLPLGFFPQTDDILATISDAEFEDCLGLAAQRGVSMEIHLGHFPSLRGKESPGLHDESFLRVFSLAKGVGCKFHFASDSHSLEGIGDVLLLEQVAVALGLSHEDLHPLVR